MRLAITGVAGFIGLRMAERALAMGWQVSGMDISEAGVKKARQLGVNAIQGDINDRDVLAQAFAGADVVFHTAAVVAEDGAWELYDRVNNQGTRAVCEVAKAEAVTRLIHLSSVMVYGFDYPANVSEEGPFADNGNPYNETKLSSERIALSYNHAAFAVTVIRPGDVYGFGSVPWVNRPLEMIRNGQMLLPTQQGRCGVINHVHVDNLLDGILLAIEKAEGGQVFNLTDDAITPSDEFFAFYARMLGCKAPRKVPARLAYSVLKLAQSVVPLLGRELPYRADGVRFLSRRQQVSCERAKQRLGYRPKINLQTGMGQLEQQLRAAGQL